MESKSVLAIETELTKKKTRKKKKTETEHRTRQTPISRSRDFKADTVYTPGFYYGLHDFPGGLCMYDTGLAHMVDVCRMGSV